MVIIFSLSLIPVFYYGYKLSTADKLARLAEEARLAEQARIAAKKFVEIEILCNVIEVPPDILKTITLGDKEINEKAEVVGEITWIGQPQPAKHFYNLGTAENGGLRRTELKDSGLKQLFVKFKLMAEIRGADLYYNGQVIYIGSPFIFKTNKYAVNVVPLNANKECWLRIKLALDSIDAWLTKEIKEGQIEKDKYGRIIGKLNQIISVIPAQVPLGPDKNRVIFVDDLHHNDLIISLDILCYEQNGALYYSDFPIRIGNIMYFTPDSRSSLKGRIIDIEEYDVSDYNKK